MVPTAILRILIVEDDAVTNETIRLLLADEAIEAVGAVSLAQARSQLAESTGVVGIVLDYTLPDGTAEELLGELAATPYSPGVVLISGHPHAKDTARRFGIPLIKKPFDIDALLGAVRVFVAGKAQPVEGVAS